MKNLLLFLACLLAAELSNAQSPVFQFAKKLGGSSKDYGFSIALDGSGNVYTMGSFQGRVDFDPNASVFNLSAIGGDDIFISKLDALGNLVWAKKIGGTSDDVGRSLAVDASGNVFITGSFKEAVDFDPNAGVFNLSATGGDDVFISKLDSSGNLVWAKQIGGTDLDIGFSIALDASCNVYATGSFYGTADFDPYVGVFNLTSAGDADIFISKLDSSGNFVWAKKMGGRSYDVGNSIKVDASGNIYTTGDFERTSDFDPNDSIFSLSANGGEADIFISKLDASGNFAWAKRIGESDYDVATSLALDTRGNIYITGSFRGTVDFDPNDSIFNLTAEGGDDIFVSKLDPSGNLVWAKNMGGTSNDGGYSITVDKSGNVYTTGYFERTADFDPGTLSVFNLSASGGSLDIFISKLDTTGNFLWATKIGGTSSDYGYSIAIDKSENVYTTGTFNRTANFDPGAETFNLTSAGSSDIFVDKMCME